VRSSVGYCMASLRCFPCISGAASRSAIVRATFRIRSCARADSPSRVTAFSSSFSPSCVIAQHLRVSFDAICALRWVFFSPLNLSACLSLAAITRPRTAAESSEEEVPAIPCTSPRAPRCECQFDPAMVPIFSTRNAGSSAPCNGIPGWDRQNGRKGKDSWPRPT
jgi:hypothetical protein